MKFLNLLGFPISLFAIVGAFSVGMAVFHGEISFSSKRLIFGSFLISFSIFAWNLPRIYRATFYDGEKWHRHFSISAFIWTVGFGTATFFLGQILLPMLRL
jgi:hypothetical protein